MQFWFANICLLIFASAVCARFSGADEIADEQFDRDTAPLLAQRCLTCHSGDMPQGKLDLSSRATALAGGESGIVIVPGDPEQSLLWNHIDSDQMPPKKPLPPAEKARIKAWIAAGAVWGTERIDPYR